ncbi:hypothetical protein ACP70R_011405 [Stipagrostis hirtigluma subsp. patula]
MQLPAILSPPACPRRQWKYMIIDTPHVPGHILVLVGVVRYSLGIDKAKDVARIPRMLEITITAWHLSAKKSRARNESYDKAMVRAAAVAKPTLSLQLDDICSWIFNCMYWQR